MSRPSDFAVRSASSVAFGAAFAQGRSNAGGVEGMASGEDDGPIVALGGRQGDGRVGTVVDHAAGTLGGAGFEKIDSHAAGRRALDQRRVHAVEPQMSFGGIGQRIIGRQHGNIGRVVSEGGQAHGDVGFSAGVAHVELRGLHKALQSPAWPAAS